MAGAYTLSCAHPDDSNNQVGLSSDSLCNLIIAALRTCSLTSAELALIANEAEAEEQRRFTKRHRELEVVGISPLQAALPFLDLYEEMLRYATMRHAVSAEPADPRLSPLPPADDPVLLVVNPSTPAPA